MFEKNKSNLESIRSSRKNNLNFMRFIAALLVIVSHSIPICYGAQYDDWLAKITDNSLNFGGVAVGFFFVMGGYLIAKSAERKKYARIFFKARIIRLFPSLIVTVVLCTFVLGTIVTSLSIRDYFNNPMTYKYLINIFLIPQHNLPGVFEANIYQNVVNGALWTLPVEFFCYIVCFIVYKLGFFEKRRMRYTYPTMFLIGMFIVIYLQDKIFLLRILRPMFLFYIGMLYYVYRDKIFLNRKWAILLFVILIGLFVINQSTLAMFICFPYICFYLAFEPKGTLCFFCSKHELSYGIYLWGWPIQQTLCMIGGIFSIWYINTIFAMIFACVFAWLNSVFIENKIILKK